MNIRNISDNSCVYIFDDIESYLTNVFVIEKESSFYIIDTFCGSDSMTPILNRLKNKKIRVINTHFHWDHVWGNCCFKEWDIISHNYCRELLDVHWNDQINQNSSYITGIVEKWLPNVTFSEKVFFHDDGIELFYSPGHTKDSISIYDHNEKVLYAGDNLERPIVYVEDKDVSTYINTLKKYLEYNPTKIVSGHNIDLTIDDINNTIKYLEGLLAGEEMNFESEYMKKIHNQNLNLLR